MLFLKDGENITVDNAAVHSKSRGHSLLVVASDLSYFMSQRMCVISPPCPPLQVCVCLSGVCVCRCGVFQVSSPEASVCEARPKESLMTAHQTGPGLGARSVLNPDAI